MKTHYDVLGIHKTADHRSIKRAYLVESLKHHPDKNGNSEESQERMKAINAAFEVLGDPAKRARYDKFELPNIERQQREGATPEGAKEETKFYAEVPKTEQAKRAQAEKEEKTGSFDCDDDYQPQDNWAPKPVKDFAEEEEQREKERQRAEAEKWKKDGEHKVTDGDKVIGSYTKAGDKLNATLGDDEGANKKMLDQMIDHALKVSKPPLKISGGGIFMHQAMEACKERGIEYKNGNSPASFFRK